MLFEYIDFLWNEYVLCPVEDLGETGKMQRAAPGTNFGEQAAGQSFSIAFVSITLGYGA